MKTLLLNGHDWTLTCYWQHFWRMGRADNAGFGPSSPPLPATVPGAVHADLLAAGLIPDWQNGLDAFKSEWVNNREWSLRRTVTVPGDFTGPITLECDGLDYSGHVLIDGRVIADFEGTHLRHCFELTGLVRAEQTFELEFLFHVAPRLEGQIEDLRHRMHTLEAAEEEDFDAIDDLEKQLDWATRVFQDRQQSLTYVCETPVILEQRAFALGRAAQALLPE